MGILNSCLDPYAPPTIGGANDFLVVGGSLNAGDRSCTITLSRSQALGSGEAPTLVSDATILLEDVNGNASALPSQGYGLYSGSNLALDVQKTYRLHIETSNGNSYISDYVPVISSSPIDSIGWTLGRQGSGEPALNIYVNTHGSPGQSPYFLWHFEETWEYTAAYLSPLRYVDGKVISIFDSTYYCWNNRSSTSILIASTAQLSQNIINHFAITSIPDNSIKLYRGYSILVKQLSLTKEAFEYWQQLKATTENLGTIFGPLPSQFSGNIHSATNPSEQVFGYFSASSTSQKRIFIKPTDFPTPSGPVETGNENCHLDMIPVSKLNMIGYGALISSYGVGPAGYYVSSLDCVDCRLKGGAIVKPDFWK